MEIFLYLRSFTSYHVNSVELHHSTSKIFYLIQCGRVFKTKKIEVFLFNLCVRMNVSWKRVHNKIMRTKIPFSSVKNIGQHNRWLVQDTNWWAKPYINYISNYHHRPFTKWLPYCRLKLQITNKKWQKVAYP